jgi:hypothetical protein
MYNDAAGPFGVGVVIMLLAVVAALVIYPPDAAPDYYPTVIICSKQQAGTHKAPTYQFRSNKQTMYQLQHTSNTIKVNGKKLSQQEAFARLQPGTRYKLTVYKDNDGKHYVSSATQAKQPSNHQLC